MSPGPQVDVLIPVYNAEATLAESLESIRRQTLQAMRIVLVDDGSTDGSGAIIDEFARLDPRIHVIRQANGGIVEALNAGLAACSAPYLARFDSDDISYPDRLERQLAYLEAHPGCVAVGCAVEHIDADARRVHGIPLPLDPSLANPAWAPALEPYIIHPFLMVRRTAIDAVGGYRHVANSEDSDLYWRLAEHGVLANLDRVLGQYRLLASGISGASIVGGRIMAIGSQLGALSARRRLRGAADLAFKRSAAEAYREAGALEAMWRLASRDLDGAEAEHLRVASGLKLLELAGYRPFRLEASDYAFIRSCQPIIRRLPAANRREAEWYLARAASRLAKEDGWRAAIVMTSASACTRALAKSIVDRLRAAERSA